MSRVTVLACVNVDRDAERREETKKGKNTDERHRKGTERSEKRSVEDRSAFSCVLEKNLT